MSNETQAVTTTKARKDIMTLLNSESQKAEIAKVLPKHLTADRMIRVATTALTRTPKLLECTQESFILSLMLCSQAGLEPDGRLAHLIPYGNQCQVIFDWKGLVALALRNGYESVYADMVCANDSFDAFVDDGKKRFQHRPAWRDRGEPYLFYCIAMRGGVLDYEIMTLEETEKIRERSRAKNNGPWVTDTLEMRKKCPIRRMSKRWDLMPEIRDMINADDDTAIDIEARVHPGTVARKAEPVAQQLSESVTVTSTTQAPAKEEKSATTTAPATNVVQMPQQTPPAPAEDQEEAAAKAEAVKAREEAAKKAATPPAPPAETAAPAPKAKVPDFDAAVHIPMMRAKIAEKGIAIGQLAQYAKTNYGSNIFAHLDKCVEAGFTGKPFCMVLFRHLEKPETVALIKTLPGASTVEA